MRFVDLIEKKAAGLSLSPEEIAGMVAGFTCGEIPDYQMSAMTMAIYYQGMTDEEKAHIIGVQANLWTEYITSDDHLEYMLLPRMAALSEVQWCQPEVKDWERFLDSADDFCAIYDKAFAGNPNIRIIDAPHKDECAYHIYEIAVPDREALLSELAKNDIYGGVHYRDNTEFSMYTYAQGTCPHAHEISQHIITMPLHMYLTDGDVERIASIVNGFVK